MFQLSSFVIIALSSLLGVSYGQIVQTGQCNPNIQTQANFNIQNFLGTWFELQRTDSTDQYTECASFSFTSANNVYTVQHTGLNDNFQEQSTGTATLTTGTAQMSLNLPMFGGARDFWILATDYTNYAIAYACENVSTVQRRVYMWILHRRTAYTNQAEQNLIESYLNSAIGITLSNLKTVDHNATACTALPVIQPGQAIILSGQCDTTIPAEQNFNIPAFTGTWHQIANYYTENSVGNCAKAQYTLSNNVVNILNSEVINQELLTINGTATVISTDNSAKLQVILNVNGVLTQGQELWVISTDYTSYAISYSCTNIGTTQKRIYSWILSRQRQLSATAQTAVNQVVGSILELNNRYYTTTDQSDAACFYLPEPNGQPVVFPGQCDTNISVVNNFNALLYTGIWYDIESYPAPFQTGTCSKAQYTLNLTDSTVIVENTQVSNQRLETWIGSAVASADGTAKLTVTFNVNGSDVISPYWVLATDYSSYALVYSCQNINSEFRSVFSWKLSRTTTLTQAANTAMNSIINSIDVLNSQYYIPRGHTDNDCFYYPVYDQLPAYIVLPGACPTNIRGVANFNAEAYMGRWYEIARYPQPDQVGQCSRAHYTLNTTLGQVIVSNTEVLAQVLRTQEGFAVVASTDGSALLNVTFPVAVGTQTVSNYYVLATDYTSYALVYSCTNTNDGNRRVSSWKLSRTPTLSTLAAAIIASTITNTQGLTEEYYQSTSQTDNSCFYIPAVNANEAPLFRGQCENITGVQGFDAQRYLGWWHEIESYAVDSTVGQCRSSNYTLDGTTYRVIDTQVQNNVGTAQSGTVTVTTDGRLQKTMTGGVVQDIWVLATDYNTYALLYSCENVGTEYRRVWSAKHSKTRSLTTTAQTAITAVMANNKVLNQTLYLNVDQTDATCFHYPTIQQGQVIISGQCDTAIPVVQNFNITDFADTWYQMERYDAVGGSSCVGSRFTLDNSNSISVLNFEVSNGVLQTVEGSAQLVSTDGSARIQITLPISGSDVTVSTTVSILTTDYIDYAFAYSCVNVNAYQRQVRAWKLSRSRTASNASTTVFDQLIQQRQELYQPYFNQIVQNSDCLEPSSAFITKSSITLLVVCALLQRLRY